LSGETNLEQMLAAEKTKNQASRAIASRRLAAPGQSLPGSPSDDDQDEAFNELSQELSRFTATIRGLFSDHYRRVVGILLGMIAFTTCLGGWDISSCATGPGEAEI
jgi:hypothetical protein